MVCGDVVGPILHMLMMIRWQLVGGDGGTEGRHEEDYFGLQASHSVKFSSPTISPLFLPYVPLVGFWVWVVK